MIFLKKKVSLTPKQVTNNQYRMIFQAAIERKAIEVRKEVTMEVTKVVTKEVAKRVKMESTREIVKQILTDGEPIEKIRKYTGLSHQKA